MMSSKQEQQQLPQILVTVTSFLSEVASGLLRMGQLHELHAVWDSHGGEF
jgi:hypothetical protein